MTIIHDGFSATRRVILKGAGAVALAVSYTHLTLPTKRIV